MSTLPLVSFCIPAFNAKNYIEDTLKSLVSQSYKNIEIIIVDDSSTDNTCQIVKELKYENVKLFNNPKRGAASARNYAFNQSSGTYIIFFDADDLIEPNFVQKQVQRISEDDYSVVLSSWGRFYKNDLSTFEEDKHIVKNDLTFEQWIKNYWLNANHTTPPGRVIISRKLLIDTPLWNENLSLNDDFQFICEVFYRCNLIKISDAKFYYRSGINGLSSKTGHEHFKSNFDAICRGIHLARKKYGNKFDLELSYSNLLKNLEYQIYPNSSDLINEIKYLTRSLPQSNLKYHCGGYTRIMVSLLGWKITKRLKSILC